MSTGVVVLCAVLGAVAGAVVARAGAAQDPGGLGSDDRGRRSAIIVANAVLWALAANKFSRGWVLLPYLVVFSVLLAVSVVDLRLFRIPDRFVFPGLRDHVRAHRHRIVRRAAERRATRSASSSFAGVGLLTYFGILFFFHIVYPRGMGFGDVKLALLMGLSLGWLADVELHGDVPGAHRPVLRLRARHRVRAGVAGDPAARRRVPVRSGARGRPSSSSCSPSTTGSSNRLRLGAVRSPPVRSIRCSVS